MRDYVLALLDKYLPGSLRPGAGGNAIMKCPFHKGGEERKPSFSVNVELGLFHCFTCHLAGDVRYLLRLLGLPRSLIDQEIAAIRPMLEENRRRQEFEKEYVFASNDPFLTKTELPEALLGLKLASPL